MKKAILISGIIWGVVCIILALIFIPIGAAATRPEVIQELINGGMTPEKANAAAQATQYLMITAGIWLLVAAVFSFVLLGVRNRNFGKGAGIALGIIGIVFGAELPGIFFIIDSARSRQ